jgi:hypothetical protein
VEGCAGTAESKAFLLENNMFARFDRFLALAAVATAVLLTAVPTAFSFDSAALAVAINVNQEVRSSPRVNALAGTVAMQGATFEWSRPERRVAHSAKAPMLILSVPGKTRTMMIGGSECQLVNPAESAWKGMLESEHAEVCTRTQVAD